MQATVMHSTKKTVRTKLVITDVDGTLSSFWDYFVPAIREFLREVSDKADVSVAELAEDIGHVIERRGTHEYPWLLEETGFAWKHFSGREQQFTDECVSPFWRSLDENRARYLRPFPEVITTLAELKRNGISVVALTDAPEYMARTRNKQLFNGLLDAVYCLATKEPAAKDVYQPISLAFGKQRVQKLLAECADVKTPFHILQTQFEKPSPHGLDQILEDFDVFPQEAVFIGDSLSKDGMVAASRGIRFVWAHYGHQVPAEYEEMVHYSLKPRRDDKVSKPLPPHLITAVAARYDEVLNHLNL
jgi:phosphoglycolate phosphatase